MQGVGEITASHPQTAGSGYPRGLWNNIDSKGFSTEFFSEGLEVGLGVCFSEVFQIILKHNQAWETVNWLAEGPSALTVWLAFIFF